MDKLIPIKIPLLNPNEPEALLASLAAAEGAELKPGQVLAVIETTKSTGEVEAEASGYLVGLRYTEGETLQAGDVLGYIGDTPNAKDPSLPPWADIHIAKAEGQTELTGLRITEPARELALAEALALEDLPQGPLVTRQMVIDLLSQAKPGPKTAIPEDEKRLVIYGAGGHGCSLAAMVRHSEDYEILGFLDDGLPVDTQVDGLIMLGGGEKLAELAQAGICLAVNGVGGVGDLPARLAVYEKLAKAGFHCPSVIHRTAFLEESAVLADGVQVYPFAYIGIRVQVGYGCIINTGAIVSHDCSLAPYVNLSPGATLAGGVTVGEAALIGMRATVNLNVSIGKRARIGNGATVKADVPDGGIVPAGTIWPPRR
jgi:sugar O-acyltransferase (sialic acid O-acetyltransferase NeuD family)